MKNIISIIIVSLSMFLAISCKTAKTVSDDYLGMSVVPELVQTYKPDTLTMNQVDSVIVADRLPDFKFWKQSTFRDAETNQGVSYKTLYDPQSKLIYTMKPYGKNMYIMFKKSIK